MGEFLLSLVMLKCLSIVSMLIIVVVLVEGGFML